MIFRVLILLSCWVAMTPTLQANSSACTEHQCMGVVDAGSTGSRLHVFSYDLDDTKSPININEIWNKKVKPGFATIEPNPGAFNSYLSDLFSGAPDETMPVYFYATAGMRLLPPPKQKKYYDELQNWFSQQTQWKLMDAKTITGNEEALYDWLSVNYHIGAFKAVETKSIGVMDIGGASVQIVFPVKKEEQGSKSSQVEFDLYGKHFTLFVHSFLGLGQNEMSHQVLNLPACFSNNYPLPDGELGQGNSMLCAQRVSALVNKVHDVKNIIQPVLSENTVNSWYAIGGLSSFADVKVFHFENNQLTLQNVLQQGNSQVCQQQWSTLTALLPNDEYLFAYCLSSAFYYALIVDGYGIHPDQTVNYIPAKQGLDWTKGVVLRHAVSNLGDQLSSFR